MKHYAALFFAVILLIIAFCMWLSGDPHGHGTAYGCIGMAVLFVLIWLAQRKED